MATGKELVRAMTCSIWKDFVKPKITYAQIFNRKGFPISLKQAEKELFCHLRILIEDEKCDEEYIKLLTAMIRLVASTSSESMCSNINENYGFYEVIIS